MESRRRRKETSWGARPGLDGEEDRICEIWIGFPVRVESTSRWVRDLWVVKRRNSGAGAAIMWFAVVLLFLGSCLENIELLRFCFDFAHFKKLVA